MKLLFLDESGDHNLAVIDQDYPLFVLGGVIVDKDYHDTVITAKLNQLKGGLFGREDIVLHTADITRNRNGFERIKETSFREQFYEALNSVMAELDYQVVACAIRKQDHLTRYGVAALDPYLLSLDVLVERFCLEIGNVSGGGMIIAEKRDPTLDRQLDLAWLNLKIQGTRFIPAKHINQRVLGLNLRAKCENVPGLQLADLVVSPIGRRVLGKQGKRDWQIVETKLRRSRAGKYEGYGLVVLPK